MKYFVLMIQFFTTIPIKVGAMIEEKEFYKGLLYFPLVGLVIGVFNYLFFYLSSFLGEDAIAIAIYLLSNTLITGALHIDGLADTCDGLLSSRGKEQMLEIMRDSRIGANGVIAIIMDFFMRFLLILYITPRLRNLAIILGPVLGKGALLFLIGTSPYGRKTGVGSLFYDEKSRPRIALGLLVTVFIVYLAAPYEFLLALILCFGILVIYRYFVLNKIAGMTGDTLGAANEIIEISFLLIIFTFERFGII